jgi:transposase
MPLSPQKQPLSRPDIPLPAFLFPTILPYDIGALKALLHAQQAAVKATVASAVEAAIEATTARIRREAQETIARMIEQMVLARHRLFDEADVLAQTSTDAQDIAPLPPTVAPADQASDRQARKPARGKRRTLPAELERVDVVHDIPEADRTCPCGTPMVEIGEDVSEQLDIVPMQIRVLRHIRKRYGCRGSLHAPVTAALPPQPLQQCQRRFPGHAAGGQIHRWAAAGALGHRCVPPAAAAAQSVARPSHRRPCHPHG